MHFFALVFLGFRAFKKFDECGAQNLRYTSHFMKCADPNTFSFQKMGCFFWKYLGDQDGNICFFCTQIFLELVYLFIQLIDVILCVFNLSLRHGKFIEHFRCFGTLISKGLLKLRLLSPI